MVVVLYQINEEKVVCLYGGPDETINKEWVENFITTARKVAGQAAIKLEMVYIGKGMSEYLTEVLSTNRSHSWEAESTHYFWRRIEGMARSESHHGAKVSTTKETILGQVCNIYRAGGQGNQSWALISQGGAGVGADNMAYGKVEVILQALTEFEKWELEAKRKDFVTALNHHLAGCQLTPHQHVCTGVN